MRIILKAEKRAETKGRKTLRSMATAFTRKKKGEDAKGGYLDSVPLGNEGTCEVLQQRREGYLELPMGSLTSQVWVRQEKLEKRVLTPGKRGALLPP